MSSKEVVSGITRLQDITDSGRVGAFDIARMNDDPRFIKGGPVGHPIPELG